MKYHLYMIVQNLGLSPDATVEEIKKTAYRQANITERQAPHFRILKKSIDARKKPDVKLVYTVELSETPFLSGELDFGTVSKQPELPPVVIGAGPAGLFCAYVLASAGLKPVIIERGSDVDSREKKVETFLAGGSLDTDSNVQFGEGGAGTFSDGKLTTLISSPHKDAVLKIFENHGAPSEILYLSKPHIGTDKLKTVIKNIRKKIISMGGKFLFDTKATGFDRKNGRLCAVKTDEGDICTSHAFWAIGHSARDTYKMLFESGIEMQQKDFSMGYRIEHLQSDINLSQYGKKYAGHPALGSADYKLACHTPYGSVYTFCMCPGGQVISSCSEEGHLVTNGMSYHARDGKNANSALLYTLKKTDFPSVSPLAGIELQRFYEKKAFELAQGRHPVQRVGDFFSGRTSNAFGKVLPSCRRQTALAPLHNFYPSNINKAFIHAINEMSKRLSCFNDADALITAPETRSSAPLRIVRNEGFCSPSLQGFYPIGEGAGYAGGIVSSAIDGIKAANALLQQYV